MGQGIADQRGTTVTSTSHPTGPGKLNDFMFRGGRARGKELNDQINASTPPKQRTGGDSGLAIRQSSSKTSAPKATSGGSRSSGRKRFNTS